MALTLKKGDTCTFGRFDGEALAWRVIDVSGQWALLITERVIDCRRYHEGYTDVTWETSSLRAWLAGAFLAEAFAPEERNRIGLVKVSNPFNAEYGTAGGADTADRIFCLSIDEVRSLFPTYGERVVAPTAAAAARGATVYKDGACWWLRSPGDDTCVAAIVDNAGYVNVGGRYVYSDDVGVRPALWLFTGEGE